MSGSDNISRREVVMLEIASRLASDGTPGAKVFRSQVEQISEDMVPCWDVTAESEKISLSDGFADHDSVERLLTVKVRALAESGDSGEAVLDPFHLFAVRVLVNDNASLDGLVEDISETSMEVVIRPEGRELVGMEMTFEVKYATRRDDPAQRG